MPLLGGCTKPFGGLLGILFDAQTITVAFSEIVLTICVPLLGGGPIPFHSLFVVFLGTFPI